MLFCCVDRDDTGVTKLSNGAWQPPSSSSSVSFHPPLQLCFRPTAGKLWWPLSSMWRLCVGRAWGCENAPRFRWTTPSEHWTCKRGGMSQCLVSLTDHEVQSCLLQKLAWLMQRQRLLTENLQGDEARKCKTMHLYWWKNPESGARMEQWKCIWGSDAAQACL